MVVTVRELLQLQSLRSFVLVAGESGLGKPVTSAGILDYECAEGVEISREDVFAKDSFVLSSLLFAKGAPAKIMEAVQALYEYGVAGMAVKTIIYAELPPEVLAFADAHAFPIFTFDDSAFFENVIYEIMTRVSLNDSLLSIEKDIESLIRSTLERQEVMAICRSIFRTPAQYCATAFLTGAGGAALSYVSILHSFNSSSYSKERVTICRYRDDILVLTTADTDAPKKYSDILSDILYHCRLSPAEVGIAYSAVHPMEEFDQCVREGYYTSVAARIEGRYPLYYKDIGTYQFLVPSRDDPELTGFMKRYLAPVMDNEDLLHTAVEYVLAKGDVEQTAKRLYCHKNTVRYRVNRLKEALEPGLPDAQFFDSLAAAVRIYLLLQ